MALTCLFHRIHHSRARVSKRSRFRRRPWLTEWSGGVVDTGDPKNGLNKDMEAKTVGMSQTWGDTITAESFDGAEGGASSLSFVEGRSPPYSAGLSVMVNESQG